MDPITRENLRNVDIKSLALNKEKFGVLTFDNAYPKLEKIQKIFIELEDFDYKSSLSKNEFNNIEAYKGSFANYLQRLADFDPGRDAGFNKDVRDRYENEIDNFYDNTRDVLRNLYTYLRQEADIKSRNGKDIQKEVLIAQKEAKKLVDELKVELEQVKSKKTNFEIARGQQAAQKFSNYFESQASEYKIQSDEWLNRRTLLFTWLIIIVVGNFVLYFYLFTTYKVEMWPKLNPDEFFTLQYAIAKLVLLSILSYGIAFATKNYHVYAQLETVNIHRKNAADTMNDLIAANPDKEDVRAEIISQAAEAMFRHLPVGHITKGESQSGPMMEIIERITKSNR